MQLSDDSIDLLVNDDRLGFLNDLLAAAERVKQLTGMKPPKEFTELAYAAIADHLRLLRIEKPDEPRVEPPSEAAQRLAQVLRRPKAA